MAKRKRVRRASQKKASGFKNVEKEIEKEAVEVEKWVLERRKFFIKLGGIILFVLVLILVLNLYLRVRGV